MSKRQKTQQYIKNQAEAAMHLGVKIVGVGFILSTSYASVSNWLKANQMNHDLSAIGAIMVLSIALFLVLHKR